MLYSDSRPNFLSHKHGSKMTAMFSITSESVSALDQAERRSPFLLIRPCFFPFAVAAAVLILLSGVGNAREGNSSPSNFIEDREKVARVAQEAARNWLARMNRAYAKDYGFDSDSDIERATTLTPIAFFGSATPSMLERSKVEQAIQQRPSSWIVPIGVDRRIFAVVIVEYPTGKPPRAVQYGMPALARRLSAGLAALDWPPSGEWKDLRVFRFMNPPTDVLLFRNQRSGWLWVNLLGTEDASASLLLGDDVTRLLQKLKQQVSTQQ